MMVDLSHVNNYTMMDALDTSQAPGEVSCIENAVVLMVFDCRGSPYTHSGAL